MVDLAAYPYPAYVPNRVIGGAVASLVGVSLIAWLIQSFQSRFRPSRLVILLLISHLTIFVQLLLRATLSGAIYNSRSVYTIINILLDIGQRLIIVSNFVVLVHFRRTKSRLSRAILIGAPLGVITSAILMASARILSFNPNRIDTSFQLRQISAIIVFAMTLFFYLLWLMSKTTKKMSVQTIVLVAISSFTCLIVAIFILFISFPEYYVKTHQNELWFYIFQLAPIALAQITWSILHPKRSLVLVDQPQATVTTVFAKECKQGDEMTSV